MADNFLSLLENLTHPGNSTLIDFPKYFSQGVVKISFSFWHLSFEKGFCFDIFPECICRSYQTQWLTLGSDLEKLRTDKAHSTSRSVANTLQISVFQTGSRSPNQEFWLFVLTVCYFTKRLRICFLMDTTSDGQEGLACCGPWGCKELDTTERLNWTLKSLCSATRKAISVRGLCTTTRE